MRKQRVTPRNSQRPIVKDRPSAVPTPLKILTVSLLILGSITMTATTSFLYSKGLDPIEFYSNLANPYMRLVNIPAGLRKEEVAERFAKALSWDKTQIAHFLETSPKDERGQLDGYYMPGPYWVKTTSTGSEVAHQMLRNFNKKVSEEIIHKKPKSTDSLFSSNQKINLDTAVRIASIIQREAAGDTDMRIISGVIWNRMFKGMSLDMDATLQYAKATSSDNWWPKVTSKDKFIDSPFNTYQNKGLPPTAIANPSLKALVAAFNPAKTDCLFYIHATDRSFYCAKTYEAHRKNVEKYLVGRK